VNHAGDSFDGFPVDDLTGVGVDVEGFDAPPQKSLAIVGSHPATRQLAPYEDENFDIWLFNESPQKPEIYKRWDASFQMHLPEVYASEHNWVNMGHWEWLQQDHGNKTIWMQEIDERVPNSWKYPLDEILDMVGPQFHYLRSTPAMALALAIYLGYKHIQLYGSELSSNTEYGYQAINYAFWIGFAKGRGVNLELHCWQDEFNQPIYGYEGELQISKDFFELRITDIETAARLNMSAVEKLEQRIQEAMLEADFQKVGELSVSLQEMAIKAGEPAGALAEAQRYAQRNDPISRQEFERVSAQAQIDGDKLKQEAYHLEGVVSYVWNVWKRTGQNMALNQLREFMKRKTEKFYEMGFRLGVHRENAQYMAEYDQLITAAGGQRAVSQAERILNG